MKALILGISGFAGHHLARFLLSKADVEIAGSSRHPPLPGSDLPVKKRMKYFRCDLLKPDQIQYLLRQVKPDRIFHLAGQASVVAAWKNPHETFAQNVTATQNLFDAMRKTNCRASLHLASSSDEYGNCPVSHMPIRETEPLRPVTPYAVSKVAQEYLAFQRGAALGLRVICTRAFNHLGPGQKECYVASSFARQIARIEKGKQVRRLTVGNLSAVRDFVDVRDVVRAYWLALDKGRAGEVYNICSGRGRAVSAILKELIRQSNKQIIVRQDPAKMRENDIPMFIGCSDKFKRLTGWQPSISFGQSLEDLLNDWRQKIR